MAVGKCVCWIEDRSRMEVLLDDDGAVTQTVCVKMEKMELIIDEASLSGAPRAGRRHQPPVANSNFVRVTRSDTATRTVSKKHWKAHKPEHEKHMELMCVLDIPATIEKAKELGAFAVSTNPAHGEKYRATEANLMPGPNKPFLIKVQIPMTSNKRDEDLGVNGAISVLNVMFLPGTNDTTFQRKCPGPRCGTPLGTPLGPQGGGW